MEVKLIEKCFAYREGKCNILNVRECEGYECSFFKTWKQSKKDKKRALDRIRSLDREMQRSIIQNYYGGKMKLLEKASE